MWPSQSHTCWFTRFMYMLLVLVKRDSFGVEDFSGLLVFKPKLNYLYPEFLLLMSTNTNVRWTWLIWHHYIVMRAASITVCVLEESDWTPAKSVVWNNLRQGNFFCPLQKKLLSCIQMFGFVLWRVTFIPFSFGFLKMILSKNKHE